MAIANRLKRLESAMNSNGEPIQRTLEQILADIARLSEWLTKRGYRDCLDAIEAGEAGPEGLHDLLCECAVNDPKHRAWARVEAALNSGDLPVEDDLQAMQARFQSC